jgi:hypothetical protein
MSKWGHFTITHVNDAGHSWAVTYHLGEVVFVPKERYADWPRVEDRISIDPAYGGMRVDQCAIGEKLVWDLRS